MSEEDLGTVNGAKIAAVSIWNKTYKNLLISVPMCESLMDIAEGFNEIFSVPSAKFVWVFGCSGGLSTLQ